MGFHNTAPWSLYVHWPWCIRKCPYCDFNSHPVQRRDAQQPALDAALESAYVAALLQDLDTDLARFPFLLARPVASIFFGGGTPSLASSSAYQRLLDGIRERLLLLDEVEITLEANPGGVDESHFSGYRAAGINRLSIGVQSFSTPQLQALGRIHSGEMAERAVKAARVAGFERINIDLMHGLPDQTPALALEDLRLAQSLAPTHLSWYQLTLEPNTEFYHQPPLLPDEDRLADIQEAGSEWLKLQGWQHYEVSAWAMPEQQCQHNLHYWRFGDYLGIGAGAHGKMSWADATAPGGLWIERHWKTRQPQAYLKRTTSPQGFVAGRTAIDAADRPLEFMMNALRLAEGVLADRFEQTTGLALVQIEPVIDELKALGLWTEQRDRLACSEQGWRYLNSVLEKFINKVIHRSA